MNIKISGGSQNLDKTITTGSINNSNFKNTKASTPTKKKVVIGASASDIEALDSVKVTRIETAEPEVEESSNWYVNGVSTEPIKEKAVKEVEEDVELVSEEDAKDEVSDAVVYTEDDKKSPISFVSNPEDYKEEDNSTEDGELTPARAIEEAVKVIEKNLKLIKIDSVREDALNKIYRVTSKYDIDKPEQESEVVNEDEEEVTPIDKMYELFDIYDDMSEEEKKDLGSNLDLLDFVFNRLYSITLNNAVCDDTIDDAIVISPDFEVYHVLDTDEENKLYDITNDETISMDIDTIINILESVGKLPTGVDNHSAGKYTGVKYYDAKKLNISGILNNEKRRDVIVLIDKETESYEAIDGNILAIDCIDDYTVNNVTIVSNEWYENASNIIDSIGSEDVEEEEIEDAEVETEVEATSTSEVPVGVDIDDENVKIIKEEV